MKNWEPPKGYIEKKYNYTYKLTLKKDPRYYYYGVHCTNTNPYEDDYFGSGTNIKKLKKEYGKDCFNKEILNFFRTKKEALLEEDKLVPISLLSDEFCLNRIQGGGTFDTTGMKLDESQAIRMRERFKGKKRSEESIKKMIETRRRRGTDKPTEETRKKLSERQKCRIHITNGEIGKNVKKEELQKWLSLGWVKGYPSKRNKKISLSKLGEKNPMFGKTPSKETIKKMTETKLKNGTNFHTEKTKAILAEQNRKRAQDPEFRKKISEALKGKPKKQKGWKRINKNGVTKTVSPDEVEKYLLDGWKLGQGYKIFNNK